MGYGSIARLFACSGVLVACRVAGAGVLVEAEGFVQCGGWVVDQQFMDQMGSPYLLAHGLGTPVEDAVTKVDLEKGAYRVWVRTRDWCRPMVEVGPGKFRVTVNDEDLGVFGTGGSGEWEWVKGPQVTVRKAPASIRLKDLTGFEGRIDALFFAVGDEQPPTTWAKRKRLLKHGAPMEEKADLVVVGGGRGMAVAAGDAGADGREPCAGRTAPGRRLRQRPALPRHLRHVGLHQEQASGQGALCEVGDLLDGLRPRQACRARSRPARDSKS